jgi:hypothetical protein
MTKRAIFKSAIFAAVLCVSPFLFGQELTFNGTGNNQMDNIYVGAYSATVNGSNQQVICDDFADESRPGTSWAVTANSFSDIQNTLWGQFYIDLYGAKQGLQMATQLYTEAGYIALQMLSTSNPTQIGYMSYAIWYLFDPYQVSAYLGQNNSRNPNEAIWNGLLAVLAAASGKTLTAAQMASIQILTPQGCGMPGTCAGQEFLEVMPEGGIALLYLLIAGTACFGAFRSRRIREKRMLA